MATIKKSAESVEIIEVQKGRFEVCILGKTPLILNRMSEKAARELLLPRKKTAADKAANLKHNPPQEYRASAYKSADDAAPTRLLYVRDPEAEDEAQGYRTLENIKSDPEAAKSALLIEVIRVEGCLSRAERIAEACGLASDVKALAARVKKLRGKIA